MTPNGASPIDEGPTTATFRELHVPGSPLVMANAWDAGSARLLAHLGFRAVATTSSGYAATLGRLDGHLSRDETLAHCLDLVTAVGIPVNADLENGYAHDPARVAETYRLATETGLAGVSIEDYRNDQGAEGPLYDLDLSVARVRAAVEATAGRAVVTARTEGYLHGIPDRGLAIERLQAFAAAGADVLYAPGLRSLDDIRAVVAAVDRPVNVLLVAGGPSVPELADAGVARVSVGGALAFAAYGAVLEAGRELLSAGTTSWLSRAAAGRGAVGDAFR